MNNYIVEEYTELDFEHVTLETVPTPYCTGCGAGMEEYPAGIHQCAECGSFNYVEIEA